MSESVLGRPVDSDEQVQFALFGAHFGDLDMGEADRVDLEGLLTGLVSADFRQAADPVALEQPAQRRAGQVRKVACVELRATGTPVAG